LEKEINSHFQDRVGEERDLFPYLTKKQRELFLSIEMNKKSFSQEMKFERINKEIFLEKF